MSKDGRVWLSHTGLEILERCPRCFWLQYKKGIRQPEGIVSRLSNRFDTILKSYFNIYRPDGGLPPLVNGDLIGQLQNPFQSSYRVEINKRYGFKGYLDECIVRDGKLIPVDFKTASSDPRGKEILPAYQAQIDDYLFLLKKNKQKTIGYGYLVFIFPDHSLKLHTKFPMVIHSVKVKGKPDKTLVKVKKAIKILEGEMPASNETCEFCDYNNKVNREIS